MTDSDSRWARSGCDFLSQCRDSPNRLGDVQLLVVGDRGGSRTVVAAILKASEPFEQKLLGNARSDVSNNSTHGILNNEFFSTVANGTLLIGGHGRNRSLLTLDKSIGYAINIAFHAVSNI